MKTTKHLKGFTFLAIAIVLIVWGDITVWSSGHMFNEKFCSKTNYCFSEKSTDNDAEEMWDLAGMVIRHFRPTWLDTEDMDPEVHCRAHLIPPHLLTYIHLGVLLSIAGGMAAKFSTLRSSVMSSFYPEAAAERHAHLYKSIISNRYKNYPPGSVSPDQHDHKSAGVASNISSSLRSHGNSQFHNDTLVMSGEYEIQRKEDERNGVFLHNTTSPIRVIGKLDRRYIELFETPSPHSQDVQANQMKSEQEEDQKTKEFISEDAVQKGEVRGEIEKSAEDKAVHEQHLNEEKTERFTHSLESPGSEECESGENSFIFGISRHPSCTGAVSESKLSAAKESGLKRFKSATVHGSLMTGAIKKVSMEVMKQPSYRTESRPLIDQTSKESPKE